MKILQIDVNFGNSSTGAIVKDLKMGFEKYGHSVECCYGRDTQKTSSSAIKISTNIEVNMHAALTRVTGVTGVFSPFATEKLKKEIEKFKPDIIHLHELHGYYININSLVDYLKIKNFPVIWTFHCEFMYTGKCGHAYDCNRWMAGCGSCPQLTDYPKSFVIDQTARMLTWKKKAFDGFDNLKIITPSEWLGSRVKQSFLSKKKISTVFNGVDTRLFKFRECQELKEKHEIKTKHVLCAIAPNLLSDNKGGCWILKLAKIMEYDDVTFIMIGVDNVPPNMKSNVICLPRINDKKLISKYYSLADFTLLTSRRETFSLVCAESLACGTPIIGFESGAPSEVAPEGYGFFVEYGKLDLLRNAVKDGFENRNKFQSRENCMYYAQKYLSKEVMVKNYLSEYEELINN